jgi:hypothetical protein
MVMPIFVVVIFSMIIIPKLRRVLPLLFFFVTLWSATYS